MGKYELVKPTADLINQYDRIWKGDQTGDDFQVKLFEGVSVDIRKEPYNSIFKGLVENEKKINGYRRNNDVKGFLSELNRVYHTRLKTEEIAQAWFSEGFSLSPDTAKTVDDLVDLCGRKTNRHAYSFSTKVFNFIDPDKYPIMDKYVVNMLRAYGIEGISAWGDYQKYTQAYYMFKIQFELKDFSYKKIDQFLWTYAKLIELYWQEEGVVLFNSTVTYQIKQK